jgi:hypothetical protein
VVAATYAAGHAVPAVHAVDVVPASTKASTMSTCVDQLCENFLYVFKAARWAARAAATAACASAPAGAPAAAGPTPVGWRDKPGPCGPQSTEGSQGRGGFDKGTRAAAPIGLERADPEGSPIAGKRTSRRPLSNPSLCQLDTPEVSAIWSREVRDRGDSKDVVLTLNCQRKTRAEGEGPIRSCNSRCPCLSHYILRSNKRRDV